MRIPPEDPFLQSLREAFATEAAEHVQEISECLLNLEANANPQDQPALVERLYREVHSLKGAARAVAELSIERLCQGLEDQLAQWKSHGIHAGPETYDVLHAAATMLRRQVQNPGQEIPHNQLAALLQSIEGLGAGDQDESGAPTASAPAVDTPLPLTATQEPTAPEAIEPATPPVTEEPAAPVPGSESSEAPPEIAEPDSSSSLPEDSPETAPLPLEAPAVAQGAASGSTLNGSHPHTPDARPNSPELAANAVPRVTPPVATTPARTPATGNVASAASKPVVAKTPGAGSPDADARQSPAEAASAREHGEETIRVGVHRLDDLLLHAEELLALKMRAETRAEELCDLTAELHVAMREGSRLLKEVRKESAAATTPALEKLLNWHQAHWRSLLQRHQQLSATAETDKRGTATLVDNLLETTKQLLLMPCSTILSALPLVVRDLTRAQQKQAGFVMEGGTVLIDKRILEEIKDPLVHLVRNAIDHGVETPEERTAAGKPLAASVTLTVQQKDANEVEITLADDGRGIDPAAVLAAAIRHDIIDEDGSELLSPEAILDLIFRSSLSTSPIITEVSGRGLGMAIVREKVEKLGGHVSVHSVLGAGTTFTLSLPVTMATFQGVLVELAGRTFVLPLAGVERVMRVSADDIRDVGDRSTIAVPRLDGVDILPLVDGAKILGLPVPPGNGETESRWKLAALLTNGNQRAAFLMDAIHHQQEVLVKPLTRPLLRLSHIAGTTIMSNGSVVPILHIGDLLETVRGLRGTVVATTATEDEESAPHLLVAEDSMTSRMLMKNILESAGYRVTTAVDGQEAYDLLPTQEFALVVSDVDMPRLTGFDLTAKIRASSQWQELPVVLVTSRSTPEDRERGVDAGANAYVVKSSFDQNDLLGIIKRLID